MRDGDPGHPYGRRRRTSEHHPQPAEEEDRRQAEAVHSQRNAHRADFKAMFPPDIDHRRSPEHQELDPPDAGEGCDLNQGLQIELGDGQRKDGAERQETEGVIQGDERRRENQGRPEGGSRRAVKRSR